jgi:hypothetical protein
LVPRTLPIFRGELESSAGDMDEATRQARHHLRGRLNTSTMALYLAQRQLQSGLLKDVDGTIQAALRTGSSRVSQG